MDRNVQQLEVLNGGSAYGVDTHKVLRNTYWLLALSMVPTVLGAWIGVQTGIVSHMTPGMSMIVFLVGAYGLMFGVNATKNSGAGVAMMLAFTFFMGLMLSRLVGQVLGGYSNGASLIMTSFGGTAGVFFGMATLATVVKRDLSGIARFASIGMMIAIAAIVMNLFMASTALMLTISVVVMVISSLFIMIDVKRVLDGGETNYITAALHIYIDLYNLFQSLLIILSSLTGNRR
ncbi:MAG: Bax inhibitor-1 family protein [Pseudomonadota bacterium]|nr:Bax inhibitor-1 family protein [Pseudomonadota bacterium]